MDAAPEAPGGVLSVTEVRRLWPEVLEEVKGKRRFTWILLSQNAHVTEVRNGTLVLSMPNVGARDSFAKGGSEDVLREALIVVLGADLKIEAMVDSGSAGIQSAPTRASAPQRAQASWDAPPAAPSAPPTDHAAEPPEPADGEEPPATVLVPAGSPAARSPGSTLPDSTPAGSAEAAQPITTDPALREQARQRIRPTRRGGSRDDDAVDDRDAAAARDDSDVADSSESHTELLARHLGAEIIAEENHGA